MPSCIKFHNIPIFLAGDPHPGRRAREQAPGTDSSGGWRQEGGTGGDAAAGQRRLDKDWGPGGVRVMGQMQIEGWYRVRFMGCVIPQQTRNQTHGWGKELPHISLQQGPWFRCYGVCPLLPSRNLIISENQVSISLRTHAYGIFTNHAPK